MVEEEAEAVDLAAEEEVLVAEVEEEVDAEVLIKVHLKELLKLERCKYRINMNYN